LELLASGRLSGDYWDWEAGRTFKFVKEHEESAPEAEATPEDPPPPSGAPAPRADPATSATGRPPFAEDESLETTPSGRRIYNPGFRGSELRVPYQLAPADGFKTPYTNYVKG